MRNENGVQAGGDRGIDVGARTVADHICQRRIEFSVAHEAPICVDVFLARSLDAIEQRTEARTRELLQLFVALTLREHQQTVTLRELLQRRLDVRQKSALALEQMRADALDLVAQAIVTRGRQLGSRLMQRDHIWAAAITVGL